MRKAASRRAATAAGQPVRAGRQPHLQPPQRPAPYQSDGPSSPATRGALQPVLGLDHRTHAKPSARSNRSARRDRAADGAPSAATTPHHPKHQHQHDHDDQHPQPCRHGGLLGRRRATQADATAAHPSKQLGHRQATSRARIDGRATRRLAGPRHPATGQPIWAGRAGCQTGRRPRPGPSGAEPFGPRPASPAATVSASTTRDEDAAGVTNPTRPQRARPARYGQANEEFALRGRGNNPSMAALRRNGRRRAVGAGPMVRAFGEPERAPRTAAPPSSPGTTPLGAARSTKDGTGRR